MQVSANIDESDVGRVTPGQDVTFRVDAFPGVDFHGTVAQIRLNPTIVNNVTTYATIVQVPNNDFRLKPGMTTNLKIQVSRKTDVLRVPNTAVRFRPSTDVFAALNQPVPPEALGGGRGRRGGAGGQGGGFGGGNRGDNAPAAAGGNAPRPSGNAPSASAQQGTRPSGGNAGNGGFGGGGNGGFGGGRGRGGFGNDPDRQARLMERFKGMAPDEQKQFIERMKGRGADTSAFEAALSGGRSAKGTAPKKAADGSFVFKPRYGEAQDSEEIQELFKPLTTPTSNARVWVFADKQLKPVTVRLGITDGTFTELVNAADLQEGSEVVTGVSSAGSTRAGAAPGGNPLLGQQGRGGGFGGRGF
jgi:hypothetical protein